MMRRILLSLSCLAFSGTSSIAKQPNVLILYADDLGFGDLSCYNSKSKIPTPHLDQLAKEGMRFTDYYAEALEFTAANARRHGLNRLDTRLVDWRKLPNDLGTFDLVAVNADGGAVDHEPFMHATQVGTGESTDSITGFAQDSVEECDGASLAI